MTVYTELSAGDTVWIQSPSGFTMTWWAEDTTSHFYGGIVGSSELNSASILSVTDVSVANGSYIELVHNQNNNNILANGWVYNSTSGAWEQVDNGGELGVNATGGDISVDGNFTIHTFTSSGFFNVTKGGNVEYLILGGGGGGSGGVPYQWVGGGGGGGTIRANVSHAISPGTYPVTVGSGGAGAIQSTASNGGDSIFDGVIATGGYGHQNTSRTGGANNDYLGGTNSSGTSNGGGAGSGGDGDLSTGGTGTESSITGSAIRYGGGGGAGNGTGTDGGGNGGSLGGNGADRLGAGGGGGDSNNGGGRGGSGIVIIKYQAPKLNIKLSRWIQIQYVFIIILELHSN